MPRRTNPFQQLTAAIMTVFHEPEYSVEESVLVRSPHTGVIREIDIRVTRRAKPDEIVMIECRAHKKPQDVQWIDALDGKWRSLGLSKVMAVSASGFTKSALLEGKQRGIELLHLKKAEEIDWRKWMFAITTLGIVVEGVGVASVRLGIDETWSGTLRELPDPSLIVLVDQRDGTRIPARTWLSRMLNDPEQIQQLRSAHRNAPGERLIKKFPCAPEMGFCVDGLVAFVPLVEIEVQVDYNTSKDEISLSHMQIAGQRLLVGQDPVLGVPTRVVMHEQKDGLTVLLDPMPGKPHSGGSG